MIEDHAIVPFGILFLYLKLCCFYALISLCIAIYRTSDLCHGYCIFCLDKTMSE